MPDVRTFGALSPFVGGDYYGAIIAGFNRAAAITGDRVMAIQTLDPGSQSADHSGIPDFRRPVAWQHLDGFFVLPGAVDERYVRSLRLAGKPVVLIGHDLDGIDCPVVLADNRAGVREAVAHLVGHGHQRIAFGGDLTGFDVRERYHGYREGLLAHGITTGDDLLYRAPDNHETGGAAVGDALISSGLTVTAIVMGTDRNAIGLMEQLIATGHDLPGQLAVVGFDDIADGRYVQPSLSSVRQPLDLLGAAAYEVVRDLAAGLPPPLQARRVRTSFVQRDSCGCPGGGLQLSEGQMRGQFDDNVYLQMTLNTQYELGIELLSTRRQDPRSLTWLGRTPALGGCLGQWPGPGQGEAADVTATTPPAPAADTGFGSDEEIEVVGWFRAGGESRVDLGAVIPVSAFPPAELFALSDGAAGEIVFVVPVRSDVRDWGVLAAVGRIQDSTPPGREMMNHSGSLLAVALDQGAMLRSLHEKEERLRQAALYDNLTGLPNRALLRDRLLQAGHRAGRQPSHHFAVLFLDLDGFKNVNDTLGHATGDQLLVQVAHRISEGLRKSDTAARLGGDEFVILLDGVDLPGGPQAVIDRIQDSFAEPFTIDGHCIRAGTSIGLAVSADGFIEPDVLLQQADEAMYQAKMRRKAVIR
jgi:diguanylate cyclase (GGDEF)-like protein